MCLHGEENRIEQDNDQVDFERSMLITNQEMWQQVYGQDVVEEGPGVIIKMPTTEEEFEEMIKDWQGDDYVPEIG